LKPGNHQDFLVPKCDVAYFSEVPRFATMCDHRGESNLVKNSVTFWTDPSANTAIVIKDISTYSFTDTERVPRWLDPHINMVQLVLQWLVACGR